MFPIMDGGFPTVFGLECRFFQTPNPEQFEYRMGPPLDSVQLPYKWLNSMVYDRYNKLDEKLGVIMVYKPTYNWGVPHCINMYKPSVLVNHQPTLLE